MKQINANNSVVMFHGIKAYTGRSDSAYESIRKVDNLVNIGTNGGEICVADKAIGSVGVLVLGTLSYLFTSDVWSEVGEGGKRQTGGGVDYCLKDLLAGLELTQARVNILCGKVAKLAREKYSSHGDYAEGWMTPTAITGIWVNKYASSKDKKLARVLARRLKVELFTVDGKTSVSSFTPSSMVEEQMEMEKVWFAFAMSYYDIDSWERHGEERANALKNRGVNSFNVQAIFSYFEALEASDDEKVLYRTKKRIAKIFNQTVEEEV